MIEIWESKITTDELPVIIPLVIYHGKYNWNISETLGEMIKGLEKEAMCYGLNIYKKYNNIDAIKYTFPGSRTKK